MSNSLAFCKSIATDPERSAITDRNWDNVTEVSPENIFDNFLHGVRKYTIDGVDDMSRSVSINIEIDFNPNADFQYFTISSSIHDGTLIFIIENLEKCAYQIISGTSYYAKGIIPQNGDTLHYTVGNFVVLSEYDMDRTKFAPSDKRWMHERTTVLLPIKMNVITKGEL